MARFQERPADGHGHASSIINQCLDYERVNSPKGSDCGMSTWLNKAKWSMLSQKPVAIIFTEFTCGRIVIV